MTPTDISEPVHKILLEKNVAVPMRDRTLLQADVYRPEAEGQFPVIIERTQGSGGRPTSLNDGRLTVEASETGEKPDSYRYDPENPIPSLASAIDALPMDYQSLEDRMLTYTTNVLDKPLTILGPVSANLYGQSTAHTFLPGHPVRVQVTSSDFPGYDRNLNTGGVFGEEACGITAANTVFYDALRPSHILLPEFNPLP